jgi:hypothetical protein
MIARVLVDWECKVRPEWRVAVLIRDEFRLGCKRKGGKLLQLFDLRFELGGLELGGIKPVRGNNRGEQLAELLELIR